MDIDLNAIRATFFAETGEHLDEFEAALIELERKPGEKDLAKTIFRIAHTIKGDSSMVGYTAMTEFAHELESLLEKIADGTFAFTPALATILLRSVDALRELAGAEDPTAMPAATRDLLKELEEASHGSTAARTEPHVGEERRSHARDTAKTLRVKTAKLDRMLDLVGELAISRGRLDTQLAALAGARVAAAQDAHRDMDRLFTELQEHVMQARLVPIGTLFQGYTRAVRDLALQTGKDIGLTIEGSEVEVDNSAVEQLREPLIHILRNAIDHGIEAKAERRKAGKAPGGHIDLKARYEAAFVVIEIADDGRGMVREKLLGRARKWGGLEDPERLTDADLQQLIFEPGFTTADKVTDLSGRGIGLDIVRRAVDRLRGTVSVKSQPGQGTTFTLRLPLTLAIIEGFRVSAGDESYVIPLESVVECVDLPAESRREAEGSGVLALRGEALPYLSVEEHFHFGSSGGGRRKIVVVRHGEGRAGIAVDELHGECQAVIKPLGSLFKQATGISGSTILGDGRVALILDVPTLLREAVTRNAARKEASG